VEVAATPTPAPGVVPVSGIPPVLVARDGIVARGVGVAAGVFVGATIAVAVRAEENVATAKVWICSTLKAEVAVASGEFPAPHEASRRAPSARKICNFTNLFLNIHTPFDKCRNKLKSFLSVRDDFFKGFIFEGLRHKRRYFTRFCRVSG
jgi:hypothetical protein